MSTVNINNTDNQVTAVNANQSIIITDNGSTTHTSVNVTQPVTSVVLVNIPGPQGAPGTGGGGTINTSSFVTTSSFNSFTSSYSTGSFTGSFTGSLFGTASYVTGSIFISTNPALSSSYALTASHALNSGGTINTSSFATTGSNTFRGNQSISGSVNITGSLFQGNNTIASGIFSHAEGLGSIASGTASHAEGWLTSASGDYSHAEGDITRAAGSGSHAEGLNTYAGGNWSHTEGVNTQTNEIGAHAEGYSTQASGYGSHAEGYGTITNGSYQHAQGQFNISSTEQSAFIIGNGIDGNNRSNLVFASGNTFQVTGSLQVSGSVTADNLWYRYTLTNIPLNPAGQYTIVPVTPGYKFVQTYFDAGGSNILPLNTQIENNSNSPVTITNAIHLGTPSNNDAIWKYTGGGSVPANKILPANRFGTIGDNVMIDISTDPIIVTIDGGDTDVIDVTVTGYLKKI